MEFRDYLNRGMSMNKSAFTKHTTGKYIGDGEQRQNLFGMIPEILKSPDEVWMNSKKNSAQLRYFKMFKNDTIIVDTTIKENILTIETWHLLKVEESTKRVGIPLKN